MQDEAVPEWLLPRSGRGGPPPSRGMVLAASRLQRILEVVGGCFATSPALLRSQRRDRALAQARFAAVALILELCPELSLPQIGRALGGRDHTSIIHARSRAAELLLPDWHSQQWRERFHQARAQLVIAPMRPMAADEVLSGSRQP